MAQKDVDTLPMDDLPPIKKKKPQRPNNPVANFGEKIFQVHTRGSTWLGEIRAGCVLFMVSAYILALNPLILSGGANGYSTGMPKQDIVLATSVSTAIATMTMGLVANYPWVVSVQLGTNSYFVTSVLGQEACGAHATMVGADTACSGVPCTCVPAPGGNGTVPDVTLNGVCSPTTTNVCIGTKIPYEQALAATFVEGLVFVLICVSGLRSIFLKLLPQSVLMAGACGIGLFIAIVGMRGCGFITAAPYPNLTGLNEAWPFVASGGGFGTAGLNNGIGFNSCVMYFDGPPFGPICPWLAMGGLIFTGILLIWNVNGAFIMGIFFTMFISWIKFPARQDAGGLVPNKVADAASFTATAGSLDFNWGDNTGRLVGALITFLYLDFLGSSITFISLGQMAGVLNSKGDMPRANIAFLADGIGSTMGGLLGSSALTTYVESASAMREGGRTGFTAVVCAVFFLISIVLWPLFSSIPDIATSPILCLIGVVIFMSSVTEIDWLDITEALPAFVTVVSMPMTNNIAYGIIAGLGFYIIIKFFSYKLFSVQKKWPGYKLYSAWTEERSMFTSIPGWNVDDDGNPCKDFGTDTNDYSLLHLYKHFANKKNGGPLPTSTAPVHDSVRSGREGLST